jgi:hypothetical protein
MSRTPCSGPPGGRRARVVQPVAGSLAACQAFEATPHALLQGRPIRVEAGFCNPALYVFDDALAERGELVVRHAVPYSDLASLTEEERRRYTEKDEPLVYGHTLGDQLGGQLDAGFLPTFLATRAVKPSPTAPVPPAAPLGLTL